MLHFDKMLQVIGRGHFCRSGLRFPAILAGCVQKKHAQAKAGNDSFAY